MMDVLHQNLTVNRVRAAIGKGKLHLFQHCSLHISNIKKDFHPNHKCDSHRQFWFCKDTTQYGSLCGFFGIVLNLINNREWVIWVRFLPGLIRKAVDEPENLAETKLFGILTHNYAKTSLMNHRADNLFLPRLWAVSGSVVQDVEEEVRKELKIAMDCYHSIVWPMVSYHWNPFEKPSGIIVAKPKIILKPLGPMIGGAVISASN